MLRVALLALVLGGLDIEPAKVVDLTHPFDATTIYWPTAKRFDLEVVHHGDTPGGYWYEANNFAAAEHGGTHLDAPAHFAKGKATVDQVPVTAGIGPLVVVDVRAAAARDADYRLTRADLAAWEAAHGRIPPGAIVVMLSGWAARWPDAKRYLGTDVRGDTANLHFPGFSREAAEFLVAERDIKAIGVDTPSIDHGPSTDFVVHRVVNGADKPGLENLANLDRLPPVGATLIALPMPIAGGSGGPVRAIAVLP
jgi:kynurenine formamidase